MLATTQNTPLLVTGAAGFIGSQFVRSCAELGLPVISVDRLSHFSERTEIRDTPFGLTVDRDALWGWLSGSDTPQLRAIVHLGACSSTTQLDRDFLRRVNVEYSKQLWDYATQRQIPFIYASSAATYGDGAHGYVDDESLLPQLEPLNPYGESKHLFDLWVMDQRRLKKTPPVWAGFKFFNVYGFGERHKGAQASVVLHAFDQIRSRGAVRLFRSHREGIADGHQKRDFVHVSDVNQILHFALKGDLSSGIYNLGTGQARTFLDLARAVFSALGLPEKIEFIDTPVGLRARYQYFTEARMEKLRKGGWSVPFVGLEDGVRKTIAQLELRHASR